jgi:hypothetical protein
MSAATTFRRVLVVLLLGALFTATGGASWRDAAHGATLAVTSNGLLEQAAAAPDGQFRVIVQATDGSAAADSVGDAISAAPASIPGVTDSYSVIPAVAATLTGDQVVALAGDPRDHDHLDGGVVFYRRRLGRWFQQLTNVAERAGDHSSGRPAPGPRSPSSTAASKPVARF